MVVFNFNVKGRFFIGNTFVSTKISSNDHNSWLVIIESLPILSKKYSGDSRRRYGEMQMAAQLFKSELKD